MVKQVNILVVEDERIVAEDIQRSLQTIGYAISGVVSSGKDALKQMKLHHPDLVLMDIVIKGKINGIETADQIRAQFDVPVVYLTAYADMDTLNKAKVTEPFGYILKPFNDGELQSTIEMALYKHRMESELKERNIQLNSLNVITQAVGETLELRVILVKALSEVLALSKFSGGVIFLLNENEMSFDIEVNEGVSDHTIQLLTETYADPLSEYRRILLKGETHRFHSTELIENQKIKKKNDRNLTDKMYCLVVPINRPARMTVKHNGVVIHDRVEMKGRQQTSGNLKFQQHGDWVQYRNLWVVDRKPDLDPATDDAGMMRK